MSEYVFSRLNGHEVKAATPMKKAGHALRADKCLPLLPNDLEVRLRSGNNLTKYSGEFGKQIIEAMFFPNGTPLVKRHNGGLVGPDLDEPSILLAIRPPKSDTTILFPRNKGQISTQQQSFIVPQIPPTAKAIKIASWSGPLPKGDLEVFGIYVSTAEIYRSE